MELYHNFGGAMVVDALSRSGIVPRHTRPGTQRLRCPVCDRARRDEALALTIDADGGSMWYCHRCHYKGGGRAAVTFTPAPHRPTPKRQAYTPIDPLAYFRASMPLAGIALEYLRYRNCAIPPLDGDLRWRPRVRYPGSDHVGAALIALITHAETRKPMSIHWTFIQEDGRGKATLEKPKRLAAGLPKKHGVIRVWPDEAVDVGLGVAEGIESALSAAHAFRPMWACIDASNLAEFAVLDGIECLTIFADHDRVGIEASKACAQCWLDAGREVRVFVPPTGDINDMVGQ